MAISVFPAGGEDFVTNDFVIDMNDTANNVVDLGRSYAQGAYDISLASGDTSFDIYAVDADGNSVGYTTDATLVTTDAFTQIAILGVAQDERITFAFAGASNDANAEGTATGAGAYLENATPTDLGNQDDTTTVTGGNFASDVQIFFESGATSTAAKNITRNDSTELIVTRPDALDPALDPWSLRAVNPGIPEPTGSNANTLADVIDAGALPVWVTTSPLPAGALGQPYSETIEATDADGSVSYAVTSGQLPTGLSLNSATGEISGTPTQNNGTFTIEATDEGGNSNTRSFEIPLQLATGGTVTFDNGFFYHTFTANDTLSVSSSFDADLFMVAGGGGGGNRDNSQQGSGGGGGAGGLNFPTSVSISAGSHAVLIGAGGAAGSISQPGGDGSDTELSAFGTAIGGGGGGAESSLDGRDGGSGGGAGGTGNNASTRFFGGEALLSGAQGNNGGNSDRFDLSAGGGGGATAVGESVGGFQPEGGDGGDGLLNTEFATQSGINVDGGYFAGGGGGGGYHRSSGSLGGLGGGGNGAVSDQNGGGSGAAQATAAIANTGGGGGGGTRNNNNGFNADGTNGASGLLVVRYAA